MWSWLLTVMTCRFRAAVSFFCNNPLPKSLPWGAWRELLLLTEIVQKKKIRFGDDCGASSGELTKLNNVSLNLSLALTSSFPQGRHLDAWQCEVPKLKTLPGFYTLADGMDANTAKCLDSFLIRSMDHVR